MEGPGPNNFTNSTDNAFVDSLGQLHLKITQRNGKWYCSEVDLVKSLGYGKYRFYLASRVDQLPQNVVLGLFTYDSDPTYHNREIDIEFSKWGYPTNFNSQYVVQPWDVTQNISRFDSQLSGDYTTHSIDWTTNKVSFESLYGHYATAPDSTYVMNSWSYSGLDIPLAGNEKIIMNLWNYEGKAPTQKVEVVIKKFEFTPITDIYVSR